MFSVHYPCHNYDQILDVLATTKTNSTKTSSLPLADFWYPDRNQLQKKEFFRLINKDYLDSKTADYCFEYPTPAYRDGRFGKTLPYSRSSMTDLMIIENRVRITIEAKYTEYVKDPLYKPLLKEWLDNKSHKENIAQCWLDYIYRNDCGKVKTLKELLSQCADFSFPYQFLHRTASACFDCESPILVYQLFYDKKNIDQMNSFEEQLMKCAEKLKLNSRKLPFYVFEMEVLDCPELNVQDPSQLFINMKLHNQYCFGETIVVKDGYTLKKK